MLTDFLLYKMLLVSWLWSIISDQIDTYEIYLLSKLESKFATWYAIKRDKKNKKKKKEQENYFNSQSLIVLSWLIISENDLVLIIIH